MKIVFLDRDGVINKYPGDTKYVTSLKEFRFLPHAKKAIAELTKGGFKIFVISNQAGVGKGLFTRSALTEITSYMLGQIEKEKGKIEQVCYCIHRPDAKCSCRKPKPGLVRKLKKKYRLNVKNAFFIGDTIRDVKTAKASGCKSILVLSGKEKLSLRNSWEIEPDYVFKGLRDAARFILKNN